MTRTQVRGSGPICLSVVVFVVVVVFFVVGGDLGAGVFSDTFRHILPHILGKTKPLKYLKMCVNLEIN